MKKILSVIGIVVLVLVVVLVLFLGQIIKSGITTAGPKLAGVPIELERVVVNPFSGIVQIKGLVIGNPEGFNTPSAMELGDFKLNIKMSSLLSDAIVIEEILISDPQITFEKGLKSSNLSELQKNLAPAEPKTASPEKPAAEAPEKKRGEAKKVMIDDFQLNGARVNVTLTALGGKTLTLSLPPIQMQGIGRDSGGAGAAEVISELLGSITGAVVDAVAGAGDLAGDALKGAGGLATDALKGSGNLTGEALKGGGEAAKGAAESIKKGLGGLLGK